MIFFVYFFPVIICVVLRVCPSILWPAFGGDQWYHMYLTKVVKENKHKFPDKSRQFVLEEKLTYPTFFHQILSYFSLAFIQKYPFFMSVVVDVLSTIVVVALMHLYLIKIGYIGDIFSILALSGILFCASPSFLGVGVGPRSYSLTPRPMSELFVMLAVLFFELHQVEGISLFIFVSAFFGGVSFLTSRFAIQVLIFFSIGLLILHLNFNYLFLFINSLVAALLLSKLGYLRILVGHFYFIKTYIKYIQHEHPAFLSRKLKLDFSEISLKLLAKQLVRNPFLIFIIRNPLSIFVTIYFLYLLNYQSVSSYVYALGCINLVCFFSYLITTTSYFKFLGEPERYIEYGIWSATLLCCIWICELSLSTSKCLFIYAFFTLPVLILSWYQLFKLYDSQKYKNKNLEDLIIFLKSLVNKHTVLCIPDRLSSKLALDTEHSILSCMDFFVWWRSWRIIYHKYPWPNTDFSAWKLSFGLDLVVFDNQLNYGENPPEYSLESLYLIFQNDTYSVYTNRNIDSFV